MGGCATSTAPQAGSETELSLYQLQIDLLGKKHEFLIDSQGRVQSKIEVSSADSRVRLSIDKGTTLFDEDREPLQLVRVVVDPSPPSPPQDAHIVGEVYKLEPRGSTYNPAGLILTLSYTPDKIPEGVRGDVLYIAYHDGHEWHELRFRRVDTRAHLVTMQIYSAASFAILAPRETAPSSPAVPVEGTRVGNLAPDFQLQDLEGQSVSLSSLRGKPVLLNFWATWCGPCRVEMPYIQRIFEEWSGRGLVLLAVNIGENPAKAREFMQSNDLSFPVLLDTEEHTARKYNIRGIPTTYFIDKNGIIQDIKIGAFSSEGEIERKLSKIVQ